MINPITRNDKARSHYSYDTLGRLTEASVGGVLEQFAYDKAGNNLHKAAKYDPLNNQLLHDGIYEYRYDDRGNLIQKHSCHTKESTSYRFNPFNQLIEVTRPDYTLRYSYDALNRRITKHYQDHQTPHKSYHHRYLYHHDNIIAILDNTKQEPTLLATIIHHPSRTDTPLSITNHTTNQTYYYHRDHQGSIIALTNQEGKVVERIEYDGHYGTILKHTKEEDTLNPYGYTGRETDRGIGVRGIEA